jgi:hypothetical protein
MLLNKRRFLLSIFLFFVCFHLKTVCQALTGTIGLDLLPLPPPWGWSQGFLATPLTLGFQPIPLLLPAFFIYILFNSLLDMLP